MKTSNTFRDNEWITLYTNIDRDVQVIFSTRPTDVFFLGGGGGRKIDFHYEIIYIYILFISIHLLACLPDSYGVRCILCGR